MLIASSPLLRLSLFEKILNFLTFPPERDTLLWIDLTEDKYPAICLQSSLCHFENFKIPYSAFWDRLTSSTNSSDLFRESHHGRNELPGLILLTIGPQRIRPQLDGSVGVGHIWHVHFQLGIAILGWIQSTEIQAHWGQQGCGTCPLEAKHQLFCFLDCGGVVQPRSNIHVFRFLENELWFHLIPSVGPWHLVRSQLLQALYWFYLKSNPNAFLHRFHIKNILHLQKLEKMWMIRFSRLPPLPWLSSPRQLHVHEVCHRTRHSISFPFHWPLVAINAHTVLLENVARALASPLTHHLAVLYDAITLSNWTLLVCFSSSTSMSQYIH